MTKPKLSLDALPDWPLLMDINEAARFLGMGEKLFREICLIEPIHIGKGAVRYHIDDLKAWANAQKRHSVKSPNQTLIDKMAD